MWCICMRLHRAEVCTTPLHGASWVLPENTNSVIWEMYLGITCGLTQPRGILGVWKGLLQMAKL